jgi:hypothetical protein
MIQLIVSGSREATETDAKLIWRELDLIHANGPISLLIEGGARGVDNYAAKWAVAHDVRLGHMPADWDKYTNRKAAGPIRNRAMLAKYPEARVLAFPKGKSPGTRNCIAQARKLGREPRVVELSAELTP